MSDHVDSAVATADPASDLTDLFAFPSPTRPGRLVLAMDVYPWAPTGAAFSDAVRYRFRLRPVSIPAEGPASRFELGEQEYAITCDFGLPTTHDARGLAVQAGICTLPNGAQVDIHVNDTRGVEAHRARVFAGLRSDPNFIDIPAYVETFASGRLAFRERGANSVERLDVLVVVVELDIAAVLGNAPGTLFAVTAETVTNGGFPIRVERFGRAEIKNSYLTETGADTINRDIDLRELYNREDPFELSPHYLAAYRARIDANLRLFDGLDGETSWPLVAGRSHPLTELLLDDWLVVDVAKPYADHTYLEIERATLLGRPHHTSGGRALNDDAIDSTLTLVAAGATGARISDGVDQATVRSSDGFPYLASPNLNPPSPASTISFPSKIADQVALIAEASAGSAVPGTDVPDMEVI